jgi:protein-L-isoaspartate(D-aspartate) O-methyltransferase
VWSIERKAELAEQARRNLGASGIDNVHVIVGDGSRGLPEQAPFDVILLSGSVARVPQHLLEQLKVGGRLAAIVGFEPIMRATLVRRVGEDEYASVELFDTVAPRLLGFDEPTRFSF